jgi:hypothetical protein
MKNVGTFFRSFGHWLVVVFVGLPLALLLNFWMTLANYLSLTLTFEMLGLDTVPLGEDKLLGSFFAGLAADASLVNLIAASLACVVMVGFFLLVRQLLEMWGHWKQMRLQRQEGNETEVAARRWLIGDNLLWLVLFLPLVACFSVWDLEMFRFRAVLGAGQITEAATAVTVATWGKVLTESADLYAITLAKVGMWGYLAVNLMACFVLEFVLVKARDKFSQMTAIASSWFDVEEQAPTETGLHEQEAQTREPGEPFGSADLSATEPQVDAPRPSQGPRLTPDAPVETIPEPVVQQAEAQATGQVRRDLKEVVGGRPEERVTLEEALRNPDRYFVNIKNGLVWDRKHWDNLHSAEQEKEFSDATA